MLAGCLLALMPLVSQGQDRPPHEAPLQITVHTDKSQYKPGETVRVEVTVTNRSPRPTSRCLSHYSRP